MSITLSSGELRVKKILKPTKAKFFQDLHEGDSIGIIHKLQSTAGGSGGGKYATYLKVMNYTRNTNIIVTENELVNRLANFEITTL